MQYRPLHTLSLEEYERVEERYRKISRCVHCLAYFLEAENIGQMRCRLHPGVARYDLDREAAHYSCCDGDTDAPGCRLADHCREELSVEDERERHEALFEMVFEIVPCGLFQYGLMPPVPENTLYDSQRPQKRRKVCVAPSFAPAMEEEFDLNELAHQVSDYVKDSPVLLRTLPASLQASLSKRCSRTEAVERLESGWPSHFDTAEGDGDNARKLLHPPDFTLPYMIVKRIY